MTPRSLEVRNAIRGCHGFCSEVHVQGVDRFRPAGTIMLLSQREIRKLSYGRAEHPTPLPAGSFCSGCGAALDAAWFAVPVGLSQNAQMARALAVAPGRRGPVPVRPPRHLLAPDLRVSR